MRQTEYVLLKCHDCKDSTKETSEKEVADRICVICKKYICDFCIMDHAESECFIQNDLT